MEPSPAKSSRYDFIGEHRGGPLALHDHRILMNWARCCAEHVFGQLNIAADPRVINALKTSSLWELGKASTGDCMKASVACHAVAREAKDPVAVAFARAVGQGVATAHMADHCMGAALYSLKSLKLAGMPIISEKAWQDQQLGKLPEELAMLVRNTMAMKARSFKICSYPSE